MTRNRESKDTLPMVRKGSLLVEKEALIDLLNKNKYETATNKLKYWKDLAWIDAEEKRLTKRICINNQYRPLVVINIQRYECIRNLNYEMKNHKMLKKVMYIYSAHKGIFNRGKMSICNG